MGTGGIAAAADALTTIVHIIQVSLAPVFLLSGIATLLNVFSTRYARVADQVDAVGKLIDGANPDEAAALSRRLTHLHRRSLALDAAVALAAGGGALTCATVLALFVGEAGGPAIAAVLYVTFGLAIACTLAAITAFACEMLMASERIRAEVTAGQEAAQPD
ncbi:MAG TPA: DUF2721 domain-containing protein [Stellaceae bacterium]|nr:DUF2721 domain-containing protein [Stellaceae bacterium]